VPCHRILILHRARGGGAGNEQHGCNKCDGQFSQFDTPHSQSAPCRRRSFVRPRHPIPRCQILCRRQDHNFHDSLLSIRACGNLRRNPDRQIGRGHRTLAMMSSPPKVLIRDRRFARRQAQFRDSGTLSVNLCHKDFVMKSSKSRVKRTLVRRLFGLDKLSVMGIPSIKDQNCKVYGSISRFRRVGAYVGTSSFICHIHRQPRWRKVGNVITIGRGN